MNEDHHGDTTVGSANLSVLEPTKATQDDGEKDLDEGFELSQLLFVVGQVAIKQMVFLELVEREWKRQKDEQQTGWFHLGFVLLALSLIKQSQRRSRPTAIKKGPRTPTSLSRFWLCMGP